MKDPAFASPPERAALGTRVQVWGNSCSGKSTLAARLMVRRGEESLLWWIWTQHARKRRQMHAWATDPRWSHVRFVRLASPVEIERWVSGIEREAGGPRAA